MPDFATAERIGELRADRRRVEAPICGQQVTEHDDEQRRDHERDQRDRDAFDHLGRHSSITSVTAAMPTSQ